MYSQRKYRFKEHRSQVSLYMEVNVDIGMGDEEEEEEEEEEKLNL
jgi:hypothetical protein